MKEIIVVILILLGSLFILIAAIGLLRFSDVLSRLHATTKATSFGMLLILTGVFLHYLTLVVFIKGTLVLVFIYLTAPLAAHAISGTVKRPGDKKKED
jgi:multicomponent Na+:H+ antiporter subunit G